MKVGIPKGDREKNKQTTLKLKREIETWNWLKNISTATLFYDNSFSWRLYHLDFTKKWNV